MKTIGIRGGMSAASTQLYYQHLCKPTRQQLGGLHSPEFLIRSVDFAEIESYQMSGNWQAAGKKLNLEARLLEQGGTQILVDAGADCLISGCTEVGVLLNSGNVDVPVFDTTQIHCEAAQQLALESD